MVTVNKKEILMTKKYEAFLLLGKTAKLLINSGEEVGETCAGIYKAQAQILRESKEVEMQVRNSSEDGNLFVDRILTEY